MQKISTVFIGVILALTTIGCGGSGEKTTASGFKYTIDNDATGKAAGPTDWVSFTIKIVGDNDKVFQEIGEGPNMPALQIPAPDAPAQQPNPILEILVGASVGDSMTVIMPIDSLPNPTPEVKELSFVKYIVAVKEVKTDEERRLEVEAERAEMEAKALELKEREAVVAGVTAQTLADYKAGKLQLTDKGGVEVYMIEEGSGPMVDNGSQAAMLYYGILKSNGEEFDNSYKRGRPFTFTVGRGEVIEGWDKGLVGMKKGAKAVLFIPYDKAYGEAERPGMPGKSDLVFYVEVDDVI